MSEPQPPRGTETNAEHKPASAGLESLAAVGARLAQLREAKGWSVADVSARLKVAAPKLRALEAGDISQMPGATFAARRGAQLREDARRRSGTVRAGAAS